MRKYPKKAIKSRKSCWREGCDRGWIIEKQEDGQLKARRCECLIADIEMEKMEKESK